MRGRRYTQSEDTFLKQNYLNMTCAQIAAILGVSKSSVKNRVAKLKIRKTSNKGRFKKGQVPLNKGKKQSEYMSAEAIARSAQSRFKKGSVPVNHCEIGTIRLRTSRRKFKSDGGEPNKWELLHRLIWEKAYGAIPKGVNIQYIDGNPENCVLENLTAVSRTENIKQNGIHNYPPEVISLIRTQKKLEKQITDHYEK